VEIKKGKIWSIINTDVWAILCAIVDKSPSMFVFVCLYGHVVLFVGLSKFYEKVALEVAEMSSKHKGMMFE